MWKKSNKLLFLLSMLLMFSCNAIHKYSIKKPPIESFVKVYHYTEITVCDKKENKNCVKNRYARTGSGVVANIDSRYFTVITAGHVCGDSASLPFVLPEQSVVSSRINTIEILDYKGTTHQAYIILSSLDNMKGSPDMCTLWVPTLREAGISKLRLSRQAPKVGQELFYMGAPAGVYHPPTVPIFKGIFSGTINASSALISVPAFAGASGSAILTMNNEIVGTLWAVHPRFHHITIVSNYEATRLFFNASKKILIKFNN